MFPLTNKSGYFEVFKRTKYVLDIHVARATRARNPKSVFFYQLVSLEFDWHFIETLLSFGIFSVITLDEATLV